MKTKYKYINFILEGRRKGRKTETWKCCNNEPGDCLGYVEWYRPWRQYCFTPGFDDVFVFNSTCLTDIANFLKQVNEGHKAKWKKK